ncbi:hypothetical protein E2C01_088490 [Portunus trituberculatus]|uniref:Uncharacterized protein n=1 Tax=Portunus trituberculatus TaxID=210409 RepID=A0A5B7JM12_PORTR|nr:hypothetical protein [Portunus trituberculatus]
MFDDLQKDNSENVVATKQIGGIEFTAPDGGWGWVVAFAAFTTWSSAGHPSSLSPTKRTKRSYRLVFG